jgi:hypothetical protein
MCTKQGGKNSWQVKPKRIQECKMNPYSLSLACCPAKCSSGFQRCDASGSGSRSGSGSISGGGGGKGGGKGTGY